MSSRVSRRVKVAVCSGSGSTAPIRLAYIIQNTAGVSALTGSSVSSDDDVAVRTMNALVSHINSNGGVGGRKISAKGFKSEATSQQSERLALCKQITEDYKAEVVIDHYQYVSEDAWSCFASHKAAYFGTVTATDASFLVKKSPYVSTLWLTMDRSIKAMLAGGDTAGFYRGGKVGVVMMDDPVSHRMYETQVKPGLSRIGHSQHEVRFISVDAGNNTAQTNAAVLAFASAGVNRVVFLGNILVYLPFTNQAESQGYHPRYIFSDYQGMTAVAATFGSSSQNRDALGVTSTLFSVLDDASRSTTDTTAPMDRKTMTPGEVRCLDILTKQTKKDYYDPQKSGDTLETWRLYCDQLFAFWEGAKALGSAWTPGQTGKALATLGKGYLSTMHHSTDWSRGVQSAASSYRVGKYTESCKCFVKVTGWLPI